MPAGQRGGLLVRAPLPQGVQQAGHGAGVVEGGVGGGIAGQQRGGLLVRARLPQGARARQHAKGAKLKTWTPCICAFARTRMANEQANRSHVAEAEV
jgi:hypothetical protein